MLNIRLDDCIIPAGKIWWILRGIPEDIGCWWRESTHKFGLSVKRESTQKFSGNFRIRVEMRGKFPQTCKNVNSPKNDIKSSLGYFHITGTYKIILHFKILRGNTREISTWKHPQGFFRERRRKYRCRKFPLISPHKSAMKSGGRGWLARWELNLVAAVAL